MVLKKAGGLFKSGLNCEVQAIKEKDAMKMVVAACALFYKKPGEKTSTIPLIIQIEGETAHSSHLRLSLRCAKNKIGVKAFYEMIMLYMST